jgi:hypothetical protein
MVKLLRWNGTTRGLCSVISSLVSWPQPISVSDSWGWPSLGQCCTISHLTGWKEAPDLERKYFFPWGENLLWARLWWLILSVNFGLWDTWAYLWGHFQRWFGHEGSDLIKALIHWWIRNLNRLLGGGGSVEGGAYLEEVGCYGFMPLKGISWP